MDRYDVDLLNELQRDSRQTVQQLAERVGLSGTPCWKRVKDLEAVGIIRGYTALIDRDKVGLQLCVIAQVHINRHGRDEVRRFEQAVADCPQIISCYSTTGEADYTIKVLVRDIQAYERFLQDVAFSLPGVAQVRSSVVLKEIKSEGRLPIEAGSEEAAVKGRRGR